MRDFETYWNECKELDLFEDGNRASALHAWISAQTSELEIAASLYGTRNAKSECPCCDEPFESVLLEKAFTDGAHWQSERSNGSSQKGKYG